MVSTIGLNLGERLELLGIIAPARGNVTTLRAVQELVKMIGISSEEHEAFEIKETIVQEGGKQVPAIKWNVEKGGIEKPFEFSLLYLSIIKRELVRLDEQNVLKQSQLTLYEKFVEMPKEGGSK